MALGLTSTLPEAQKEVANTGPAGERLLKPQLCQAEQSYACPASRTGPPSGAQAEKRGTVQGRRPPLGQLLVVLYLSPFHPLSHQEWT